MVLSALTIATTTGTSGLLASNSIIQRTANRYAECRLKATRQLRKKQRKALSAIVNSRPSAIHRTLSGLMLEQKYIRHYWQPYWRRGVLIIGCLASYQASQMMIAYLVKVVIDGATGISTLSLLPLLGASLIIAYPVGLWMSVKAEQLIARVQSGISAQVRMDLFDKLQTLSSDFMQKMRPGDIAARFINDVDEFVEAISYNFIYAVFRLFAMMLVCAQLWFIEWHLTVLVLGVLPIAIMLYNHFRPKAVEAVYRFHEAEGDVNHQVQENLRIQSMIKSFDAEATFSVRSK
jgi:subfamily B ATP-binding cassette protein MsbA